MKRIGSVEVVLRRRQDRSGHWRRSRRERSVLGATILRLAIMRGPWQKQAEGGTPDNMATMVRISLLHLSSGLTMSIFASCIPSA